jgi:hypothetical protein
MEKITMISCTASRLKIVLEIITKVMWTEARSENKD